jgi:hypothetical protein
MDDGWFDVMPKVVALKDGDKAEGLAQHRAVSADKLPHFLAHESSCLTRHAAR